MLLGITLTQQTKIFAPANEQLQDEDIIDDVIRPTLERYTEPAFWQDVEP